MIVRALDIDHDWTFGKGRNNYLSASDAIAQDIQTRLLSFLGDCFFDITAGIDWFNLLGKNQRQALELSIASVILNTSGVTSLVSLSSSVNETTRVLSVSYVVNTIYTGLANVSQSVAATSNFLITQDGIIITTEDGNPITIEP